MVLPKNSVSFLYFMSKLITDVNEIELPYLPDDSWITDRRNFSGYADHVSYQYLELLNKGKLEFDSLADVDIVDPLCNNVFDHKGML